VPFSDRLKDAIEEMARRRETNDDAGEEEVENGDQRRRPQSSLTPREMQARLRAGSTLAEVARDAGIDEAWVEPFAVPILAERAEVVSRARQMTLSKARLGESAEPLGAAVRWNLAGKGLGLPQDTFDAAWTAWNVANGSWIVRFSYMSRRRTQSAEWEVDLRAREVVARNRLASELGYVEPASRRSQLQVRVAFPAGRRQRRWASGRAGSAEERAEQAGGLGVQGGQEGGQERDGGGETAGPGHARAGRVVEAGGQEAGGQGSFQASDGASGQASGQGARQGGGQGARQGAGQGARQGAGQGARQGSSPGRGQQGGDGQEGGDGQQGGGGEEGGGGEKGGPGHDEPGPGGGGDRARLSADPDPTRRAAPGTGDSCGTGAHCPGRPGPCRLRDRGRHSC